MSVKTLLHRGDGVKGREGQSSFGGWLVAAVFVAALVLTGLVLTIANRPGGSETEGGDGTPVSMDTCPEHVVSTTIPDTAPPNITWEAHPSTEVNLPYHNEYGPQITDGPVAHCFSHDPMGAVMAATHINTRGVHNPDAEAAPDVLIAQMTEGPVRDQLIEQKHTTERGFVGQWTGFAVLDYSDTETTVLLTMGDGAGRDVAVNAHMVWIDGEWVMDSDETGSTAISKVELHENFTPWRENAW